MRYLAILLLAPWLLILCWAYWAYPKSLPRTSFRRIFDVVALLLAMIAAVLCASIGFDLVKLPAVDHFGRASGAIWQQVLPALYGYAGFAGVLGIALWARHGIFHGYGSQARCGREQVSSHTTCANQSPDKRHT